MNAIRQPGRPQLALIHNLSARRDEQQAAARLQTIAAFKDLLRLAEQGEIDGAVVYAKRKSALPDVLSMGSLNGCPASAAGAAYLMAHRFAAENEATEAEVLYGH